MLKRGESCFLPNFRLISLPGPIIPEILQEPSGPAFLKKYIILDEDVY